MMRTLVLAGGLALAAGERNSTQETPFDPPFAFPALAHHKGLPTDAQFNNACFNFIYDLMKSDPSKGKGGSVPLEKRPAAVPAAMMPSCLQADKKGCQVFAEQLEKIIQRKMQEGPIGHVRTAKEQHAQEENAPESKPVAKTVHFHKPGSRVKAADRAAEDGALVQREHGGRPLRFNDWCNNMYAVATSTYTPEPKVKVAPAKAAVPAKVDAPAKAAVPAKAKEKAQKVPGASLKKFGANTTQVMATTPTVVNATKNVETNATKAEAPAKHATKPLAEAAKANSTKAGAPAKHVTKPLAEAAKANSTKAIEANSTKAIEA